VEGKENEGFTGKKYIKKRLNIRKKIKDRKRKEDNREWSKEESRKEGIKEWENMKSTFLAAPRMNAPTHTLVFRPV
jgi:hypothetical protein